MVSQVPTLKKTKMTSYTCHLGLKGMYIENKNQDDEVQFIILVHKVTLTGKKHDNERNLRCCGFKICNIKKTKR